MFASKSGRAPVVSVVSPLPLASALVLAVLLSACANTQTAGPPPGGWTMPGDMPIAQAAPSPSRVEMEDDGMEAQVAPPRDARPMPDDPNEPWSPNYGSRGVGPMPPAARPQGPDIPGGRPAAPVKVADATAYAGGDDDGTTGATAGRQLARAR